MERAARFGFGAMNPGTLYRTLRHVGKDVLCESEWETNEAGRHTGCTRSRTPGRCT
jgi:PadR family transcriptional regulator PadR